MLLLTLLCAITSVHAASKFAGVNIAGFDFGVDITGTALLANAQGPLKALGNSDGAAQMQHFAEDDQMNLFRLPVSWQFLINSVEPPMSMESSLNMTEPMAANMSTGALDANNFAEYDMLVQACLETGATCVIDIHNYARFNDKIIGQGGPSDADFANLWSQIATKYAKEEKIVFGLMNEPHDIPDMSIWATTVQAAVTAIREAGATTQMILLPGNDFTGAQTFVSNGSAGNLSTVHNLDGTNTSLIFDVHKYLDVDGSGTHTECVSDHVEDTFMPLAKFLIANERQAILSEVGAGNTDSCLKDMCTLMTFLNSQPQAYIGYSSWAAGGFDATYNLTETPLGAAGNFSDQPIVTQCVAGIRNNLLREAGVEGNNTSVTISIFNSNSPFSNSSSFSSSSATNSSNGILNNVGNSTSSSSNSTDEAPLRALTSGAPRMEISSAVALVGSLVFAGLLL